MNCDFCNKELKGRQRRFCCASHNQSWHYHNEPRVNNRVRANSRVYWEKNKDNKEFKKDKVKRTKKWIEENREHWRELMRPVARESMRRRYKYRKENHLCWSCGTPLGLSKWSACEPCLEEKRVLLRKRYKNQSKGVLGGNLNG
jgi:hypothetical protein